MTMVNCSFELTLLKSEKGNLCASKLVPLQKMISAEYFIETGTYLGDTTHAMKMLFKKVVSIELSEELYLAGRKRFSSDDNVVLLHGDSAERISDALSCVGERRAVIWLDAHWSGGNTAKANGNTPILAELQRIKDAGVGDVVILIDDVRYFWDVRSGFNVHDSIGGYPEVDLLVSELKKINPNFVIFVNGDIMFAIPKDLMGETEISPVLSATSQLRMGYSTLGEIESLETTIAEAKGGERDTILRLPEFYKDALTYGIGGHFCYWRALVNERLGRMEDALRDFSLARNCGVEIAKRRWEADVN
ncbi:hypothetical protein [Thalassospira profundimaris]|uniref:hypothetical protein n=1 Tax=Thalassospira profundimaris TaxID=502049 RepID=UPI0002872232|nr:hypothetical protein [Thalassospira profundimaris]EKF09228.1 hypothetical protein TH2_05038 [Thalassospira profundimaris WP0211]